MSFKTLQLSQVLRREIHACCANLIKKNKLPSRPKFTLAMEADLEEKFLHGGRGPGGQKINKCNSKVQLKHMPSGIVVECQETRSRHQNRKLARDKLALQIARWQNGGEPIARETAIHEWEKQGKKSRERKSRDKHEKHDEERKAEQLRELEEEEKILNQLMH
ncbi:LANO_0C04852g1_1 [Lachancea nothofagi CBS 11611]|uniref:LANO_0C04852g1_1 n=1 Tax=Lachancea nothofagi CBS 11611 TaxID=1266666 RepID=A0A1G4J6Z6_9SACH|nr:LANO_0C04852g1_1 [Lachancea nothofagi CBS 11611]